MSSRSPLAGSTGEPSDGLGVEEQVLAAVDRLVGRLFFGTQEQAARLIGEAKAEVERLLKEDRFYTMRPEQFRLELAERVASAEGHAERILAAARREADARIAEATRATDETRVKLARMVATAEEHAERIRTTAQVEAAECLAGATRLEEATRLEIAVRQTSAEEHAERILTTAREEADHQLGEANRVAEATRQRLAESNAAAEEQARRMLTAAQDEAERQLAESIQVAQELLAVTPPGLEEATRQEIAEREASARRHAERILSASREEADRQLAEANRLVEATRQRLAESSKAAEEHAKLMLAAALDEAERQLAEARAEAQALFATPPGEEDVAYPAPWKPPVEEVAGEVTEAREPSIVIRYSVGQGSLDGEPSPVTRPPLGEVPREEPPAEEPHSGGRSPWEEELPPPPVWDVATALPLPSVWDVAEELPAPPVWTVAEELPPPSEREVVAEPAPATSTQSSLEWHVEPARAVVSERLWELPLESPIPEPEASNADRAPDLTPPQGEDLGDFFGDLRGAMEDDTPLGELGREPDKVRSREPMPEVVPISRWARRDKPSGSPGRRRR